jgi:hypothetical protein
MRATSRKPRNWARWPAELPARWEDGRLLASSAAQALDRLQDSLECC